MRPLILKTQLEVLDDIEAAVSDTGNALWTAPDIYRAINVALRDWREHVFIPQLYDLPSGFSSGIYEYTLPSYIGNDFQPYIKASVTNDYGVVLSVDSTYTWDAIQGWTVEPDGSGGRKLRLLVSPYSDNGRLIWYAANGPVPTTVDTLSANITSSDTSLVLATAQPQLGEAGYVKIDGEWISYAGITRGASTTTLSNLVRGLLGTTAASHTSTTSVYVGIAADDDRLWEQLEMGAIARLHFIMLHRGTTEDRSNHEKMMGFCRTEARNFWRMSGYTPAARTRLKLNTWWR